MFQPATEKALLATSLDAASDSGESLDDGSGSDDEKLYSTGLFDEMEKKLGQLESMRKTMAKQNEDTAFIDERIEELKSFMQETKDEYEAMELDDGKNRKRTRDADGSATSELLVASTKEYFTTKGQKFKDFLHDDNL